ncbi:MULTISPECIES: hypothetical protein [unclassified Gordonia (in: high G+C Gram-positive bacteria)]
MSSSAGHIWGRPQPTPDRCAGPHTYAGGCRYNADDPHRPLFPPELRPGNKYTAAA